MRRWALGLAIGSGLLIVYLAVGPSPVDPAAYQPPAAPPLTGALAPNTLLRKARHLGVGRFAGPEDVAIDDRGRVYGGTSDGFIHRTSQPVAPGSQNLAEVEVERFAETGGRPLGLGFAADGALIVADAWKGLLSIAADGAVTTLSSEAEGVPFGFTDDLAISGDGSIYFSDASARFHQPDYLYDLLEARPHGRLLRYDPAAGTTHVVARDLYFANGVALSEREDFVLVNETYRYRILRFWLRGPRAGRREVFVDNLPGFPDNLSSTKDGRFWVALFTVRNPMMDALHPHPLLKRMLARLPKALWPKPAPYGFVMELDETGQVLRTLQDPGGQHLRQITSVKEHDGVLYLGSLYNDRIGVARLSTLQTEH